MSVPHTLLALLADAPSHGYGLKTAFEHNTDGHWPLNVGQVYTTLARLHRDGLVATEDEAPDGRSARWFVTGEGRDELRRWYQEVSTEPAPRDEMILRVLVAIATAYDQVQELIDHQRDAFLQHMQVLARRKRELGHSATPAALLFLDSQLLRLEADVRWLDRCTERLREEPRSVSRENSGGRP